MSDLVAFLRARVAEDEEDARKAGAASEEWRFDESQPTAAIVANNSPRWESYLGSGVWNCDDPYDDCEDARREARDEAEHIVRWDPARVLAEVEVKRAILALYEDADRAETLLGGTGDGAECRTLDYVLRQFTRAYAEHPDFDPEWSIR